LTRPTTVFDVGEVGDGAIIFVEYSLEEKSSFGGSEGGDLGDRGAMAFDDELLAAIGDLVENIGGVVFELRGGDCGCHRYILTKLVNISTLEVGINIGVDAQLIEEVGLDV
jgi:hypothetical protein